jgi:hypothetical protein
MSIVFDPFTYCIYCGSIDCRLTDEHIIPLSLNGDLILPKSSCESCANITKKFEQIVARNMYGHFRLKHNFKTRRKKERNSQIAAVFDMAGIDKPIVLPASEVPTSFVALKLPPPGIFSDLELSDLNPEMKIEIKANTKEWDSFAKRFDARQIQGPEMNVFWGPFCQLLAKIAHSYAMAVLKGNYFQPYLNDLILGKSHYLSHYVGGSSKDVPNAALWFDVVLGNGEWLLCVGINLLGNGSLPSYQVVVGKVTDSAILDKL